MSVVALRAIDVEPGGGLVDWLADRAIGLVLTGPGWLLAVGGGEHGPWIRSVAFSGARALGRRGSTLEVAGEFQLARFEDLGRAGSELGVGADRVYVPTRLHTTGAILVGDVHVPATGDPVITSQLLSCVASLDRRHGIRVRWMPAFVPALTPTDACHLTGVVLDGDLPRYATVATTTPSARRWQEDLGAGAVVDVATSAAVASGLSVPASPRRDGERLWVIERGAARLTVVDPATGQTEVVAALPGHPGGLRLVDSLALVVVSRQPPAELDGIAPDVPGAFDGVVAVDRASGEPVARLELAGRIEGLGDLEVLDGCRRPLLLGGAHDAHVLVGPR